MKERFRAPSYILALSLISNSCSPAEAAPKIPDYSQRSDFPKGLWRYTGGPHGNSLNAIDIAPEEIINCPLPQELKGESKIAFSALKGGTIHSIEPQSGVIRVEDKDGVVWEYRHLKPSTDLKKGAKIQLGNKMGKLACIGEIKGGLHAHVGTFIKAKDGTLIPIPIDKRKIGRRTIYKGETEYNGTLLTPGEPIRIADARDCIPGFKKPEPCGKDSLGRIILNDIYNTFVDYVR